MSVSVHPAMGLPPNGSATQPDGVDMVADKFAQQMGLPLGSLLPSEELQMEDEYPMLSHGQVMQTLKEEDFTFVKTDCERVPGDPSTTFAAFAVRYPNLKELQLLCTF